MALTLRLRETQKAQMSIFLQSPLCFRGGQLRVRLSEVSRPVWIWWDSELWHYTHSGCPARSGQMQNAGLSPWQQHTFPHFADLHGSVGLIPVLCRDPCYLDQSQHGCMSGGPMVCVDWCLLSLLIPTERTLVDGEGQWCHTPAGALRRVILVFDTISWLSGGHKQCVISVL